MATATTVNYTDLHTLHLHDALPIFIAGIGGLQAAALYEPAFAVIARRVGAGRARAGITAITLWGGFASTVFIPLVQFLLNHWGWRDALLVLALVNGLVCAVAYFGFIRPEQDAIHFSHADIGHVLTTDKQEVRADRKSTRLNSSHY